MIAALEMDFMQKLLTRTGRIGLMVLAGLVFLTGSVAEAAPRQNVRGLLDRQRQAREGLNDDERARMLYQKGIEKLEAGKENSALEAFEELVEDHPRSPLAPEAHYQRGLIFSERHQFLKAHEELQAILALYPNYDAFNRVIDELFDMGQRIVDGERPHYFGLVPGFKNRETGVEILSTLVRFAPFSDNAPQALRDIAVLYEKIDEPELAIGALDRLINRYPRNVLSEDAYLHLARLYEEFVDGPAYDQAATREAIRYYEDFLILYPRSPRVPEAEAGLMEMRDILSRSKYRLGRFFYFYRNLDRAALVFLNEAITIAPDSQTAQDAERLIARIESGEDAPRTPADWLFGRYKHPRQYILERPDEAATTQGDGEAP